MHSSHWLKMLVTIVSMVTYINGLPVEGERTQILTMAGDPKTDIQQYGVNNHVISSDTKTVEHPKDHHKTRPHHRSMKRRHGHRRIHHVCRTTETPTTKPTSKNYNALPNMFISQNWGPGR